MGVLVGNRNEVGACDRAVLESALGDRFEDMASGWVARGGTDGNEDQEDEGLDVHCGYWVSAMGMMSLEGRSGKG